MIHPLVTPAIALITGIIILIFPRVLNYIVAFYLIILGVLGLIEYFTKFGGKL